MRRFICPSAPAELLHTDVLIIGGGIAGLYTSINLDPALSCIIATKEDSYFGNSWLAQGGIAAAVSKDDMPLFHMEDTMDAGAGICDSEAVRVLVDEGPQDIQNLRRLAVPFDLNADGDLHISREGGHRRDRIVHAGGDATGRETVKVLTPLALKREKTQILEHVCFLDILTNDRGEAAGALLSGTNGIFAVYARSVVICTGGAGRVYKNTTNPHVATGDGQAAALRAGAALSHMEFVQFHPTGLYCSDEATGNDRAFLISEAVRGEGGVLLNDAGLRFLENAHPMAELAPRDIVARAIYNEMERSGKPNVWLDITCRSAGFLSSRFPTIYNECLKHGIDISRAPIPVCPVQHYMVGGIATDLHGMSSIKGLYACGEAAYTGVHGANRLASNSMLECLVFGRRAAESISGTVSDKAVSVPFRPLLSSAEPPESGPEKLRTMMESLCGVVRCESGLTRLYTYLDRLCTAYDDVPLRDKDDWERYNMLLVSRVIASAALARRESVGSHYIRPEAV